MNIAEKVKEILPQLKAGVDGIEVPDIKPEEEEEWTADYAILCDYFPDPFVGGGSFFDTDSFNDAFFQKLAGFFTTSRSKPVVTTGRRIKVTTAKSRRPTKVLWVAPGTILIIHHAASQEIEVYKAKARSRG